MNICTVCDLSMAPIMITIIIIQFQISVPISIAGTVCTFC